MLIGMFGGRFTSTGGRLPRVGRFRSAGGSIASTYEAMSSPSYNPKTGKGNAETYHAAGEGTGEPGITLVLEFRDRYDGMTAMKDLESANVDVRIVE